MNDLRKSAREALTRVLCMTYGAGGLSVEMPDGGVYMYNGISKEPSELRYIQQISTQPVYEELPLIEEVFDWSESFRIGLCQPVEPLLSPMYRDYVGTRGADHICFVARLPLVWEINGVVSSYADVMSFLRREVAVCGTNE